MTSNELAYIKKLVGLEDKRNDHLRDISRYLKVLAMFAERKMKNKEEVTDGENGLENSVVDD